MKIYLTKIFIKTLNIRRAFVKALNRSFRLATLFVISLTRIAQVKSNIFPSPSGHALSHSAQRAGIGRATTKGKGRHLLYAQ